MVRPACIVDLSHLDPRALQMVLEPTFVAMDMCGSGARTWGFIAYVGLRAAWHDTCAGTQHTVVCAKGGVCHIWPNLEFGP